MAEKLPEEIKKIINDESTVAVLSAVEQDGNPYAQVAHKIAVKDDGRIAVHQLLEKSQLQKNLVYSIWFSKKVSLVLAAKNGERFHLYLKPYQAVIAGREFTKEYIKVLAEYGNDADLSTIWLFDVESFASAKYSDERAKEKAEHPYLYHMDKVAKEEYRA